MRLFLNNTHDTETPKALRQRYEDGDIFHNLHPGIPPVFFTHSSGDGVVPYLTVLRAEKKIQQLTAADLYVMDNLDSQDIPFLDMSRWEIGLPHNYMYAMGTLGKSFYLEEKAGKHDLQNYSKKTLLEQELRLASDPVVNLYDLDVSLREWILRIDESLQ